MARNVDFFVQEELQHEHPIGEIEQEIFHRFVAPVRFKSHVWTIGLSTPLSEIMATTGAQGQRRFIFAIMACATVLSLALLVLALRGMARRRELDQQLRLSHGNLALSVEGLKREIERRKQTEAAVQEVNTRRTGAAKTE